MSTKACVLADGWVLLTARGVAVLVRGAGLEVDIVEHPAHAVAADERAAGRGQIVHAADGGCAGAGDGVGAASDDVGGVVRVAARQHADRGGAAEAGLVHGGAAVAVGARHSVVAAVRVARIVAGLTHTVACSQQRSTSELATVRPRPLLHSQ